MLPCKISNTSANIDTRKVEFNSIVLSEDPKIFFIPKNEDIIIKILHFLTIKNLTTFATISKFSRRLVSSIISSLDYSL